MEANKARFNEAIVRTRKCICVQFTQIENRNTVNRDASECRINDGNNMNKLVLQADGITGRTPLSALHAYARVYTCHR